MRLLVTGGAGFIGSNFIRYCLEHTDYEILNLDCLTYAGNLENLSDIIANYPTRYQFINANISNRLQIAEIFQKHSISAILNFAAESHVDRSILDSTPFILTNILGTQILIETARKQQVRFLQVSTDEVYGSLESSDLPFTEDSPLQPNSPYAASKASADLLCRSFYQTFKQDIVITRCTNNYGPYQFPEKFIPLMILKALKGEPLPVYGDGLQIRDWLHVEDHCRAILLVLEKGQTGQAYNIGGSCEKTNLSVLTRILEILKKPATAITHVKDRPGHDRRYGLNTSKIERELGWQPLKSFEQGLNETIQWYLTYQTWWERVLNKEYLKYFKENYEDKFK